MLLEGPVLKEFNVIRMEEMFWNHDVEVSWSISVDDVESKWIEGNEFLGVCRAVDVNPVGYGAIKDYNMVGGVYYYSASTEKGEEEENTFSIEGKGGGWGCFGPFGGNLGEVYFALRSYSVGIFG